MRKIILSFSMLFLAMGFLSVSAEETGNPASEQISELTKEQQAEVEAIHKAILDKKLELVDKHVEFGIISQEKGDKMKEKLNNKFEKMKEKGFMPHRCKKFRDDDDM